MEERAAGFGERSPQVPWQRSMASRLFHQRLWRSEERSCQLHKRKHSSKPVYEEVLGGLRAPVKEAEGRQGWYHVAQAEGLASWWRFLWHVAVKVQRLDASTADEWIYQARGKTEPGVAAAGVFRTARPGSQDVHCLRLGPTPYQGHHQPTSGHLGRCQRHGVRRHPQGHWEWRLWQRYEFGTSTLLQLSLLNIAMLKKKSSIFIWKFQIKFGCMNMTFLVV